MCGFDILIRWSHSSSVKKFPYLHEGWLLDSSTDVYYQRQISLLLAAMLLCMGIAVAYKVSSLASQESPRAPAQVLYMERWCPIRVFVPVRAQRCWSEGTSDEITSWR